MTKMFKVISGLALIALSCVGVTALQYARLQRLLFPNDDTLPQQVSKQIRQEEAELKLLMSLPDFGFSNLIADWVFLQFLQYFGNSEHRNISGYGLSGNYFDVIVDRDPYFYDPYIFLSSSLSLFAGQPERAVELQEKGLASLQPDLPPRSYFIWRSKGVDELLFLGDAEASSRSHAMAAEWAAQSSYPTAQQDQQTLARAAQFYAQNPDSSAAQINSWAQILMTAPDEKTRAIAVENIESLGGAVVQDADGRYSIQRPDKSP